MKIRPCTMKDYKLYIVRVFLPLVLLMSCHLSGTIAKELGISPSSTVNARKDSHLGLGNAHGIHPHGQDDNGTGNRLVPARIHGYGTEAMDHHVKEHKEGQPPGISLSIDSRKDC